MTKAHTLSASQVAAFPNVLRSQETMDPMMPGRAAAALPAKLVRARPRACRCFLIHTLDPALVGWLWSRRRHWRTSPTGDSKESEYRHADRCKDARDRYPLFAEVRSRSASVLSSWRSRLMVSRILLICDLRAALFVERASSLACLSSSMSESSPLSFSIRSRISC